MFLDIYIFRWRVQLRQAPECLRSVKSRRGGDEVSSFEKKVEGRSYVVKAEGPGPRGEVAGERQRWRVQGVNMRSPSVDV